MPRGGTWGYRGGGGGGLGVIFFPKFNHGVCVTHKWHMHRHNFLGPRPLGPLGGVKNLISEHWHVAYRIKGDGQYTRIH